MNIENNDGGGGDDYDDGNNGDGGDDYVAEKFLISALKYVYSVHYEVIHHSDVMSLFRYRIMYTE
jgi:hypothetical protein